MPACGDTRSRKSEAQSCRCRYCGREVQSQSQEWRMYQPFCSERCKLADLDCWLEEEYRIPGGPEEPEDDAEPAGEPDRE
jgi:endogenous inhibitor of DNA gyrase (YacG/DUF329 family)